MIKRKNYVIILLLMEFISIISCLNTVKGATTYLATTTSTENINSGYVSSSQIDSVGLGIYNRNTTLNYELDNNSIAPMGYGCYNGYGIFNIVNHYDGGYIKKCLDINGSSAKSIYRRMDGVYENINTVIYQSLIETQGNVILNLYNGNNFADNLWQIEFGRTDSLSYLNIYTWDIHTPLWKYYYGPRLSDKFFITFMVNNTLGTNAHLFVSVVDYYDTSKMVFTPDEFSLLEFDVAYPTLYSFSFNTAFISDTTIYAENSNVNFPYYHNYVNAYYDNDESYDFTEITTFVKMENAIYRQNDYGNIFGNSFLSIQDTISLAYSNYSNNGYMYSKAKKFIPNTANSNYQINLYIPNFSNFLAFMLINYTVGYSCAFANDFGTFSISLGSSSIILKKDSTPSTISYYHNDNKIGFFIGYNGTDTIYGCIVGNRIVVKHITTATPTVLHFYLYSYNSDFSASTTETIDIIGYKLMDFPEQLNNHYYSTSLWLDYKFNFDFFYPIIRNFSLYNFQSEQFNLPADISGYTINYYSVKSIVLIATQIISDNCMYKYLSNNQIVSDFYTISVINGTIVLFKYWLDWKHIDYYVNSSFLWYYTAETNNSFFVQDLYFTITWDLYVSQNVDTTITISINIILPLLLLFLFPYAFYQSLGKKGAIFGLIFGFIVFGICQLIETLYMYLLVALSMLIVVYYLKNQKSEEL